MTLASIYGFFRDQVLMIRGICPLCGSKDKYPTYSGWRCAKCPFRCEEIEV
jgi:hypothetical protein